MATHDEDLIGQAIAATEKEIFGEAFGQDEIVHDETGDRSNEQMGEGLEGQHEPPDDEETESEDDDESPDDEEESEGEEEEGEADEGEEGASEEEDADAEPEQAAQPPVKPEGRVPSGRLREQTERAERAEGRVEVLVQERDADRQRYDRDIGDLRQRFDALTAALHGRAPQAAPQTPSPESPPDIFENPQGYTDFQNQLRQRDLGEVKQMLGAMRFQNSMDIARAMHGDKFNKAWDAVNKLDARNADDFGVAQRIFNAPDPGGELLKWHARQETLRVVGDDPEKYKQTITSEVREAMKNDPEFRKQILDELRAEATGDRPSRPARHVTRLPKSLNGAQGQGSNREKTDPDLYDDSDQSVWNSAWR